MVTVLKTTEYTTAFMLNFHLQFTSNLQVKAEYEDKVC